MIKPFLLASLVAFCATSVSATTVMNGDFETVDGRTGITGGNSDGDRLDSLAGKSGGASWDVYETLPGGWYSRDTGAAGIEIQTNNTVGGIKAHSGSHYVELDSEKFGSTSCANVVGA